jgi:hypothetical protein
MPVSAAYRSADCTSLRDVGRTTAAGRRVTAPFQSRVAALYAGDPGKWTRVGEMSPFVAMSDGRVSTVIRFLRDRAAIN